MGFVEKSQIMSMLSLYEDWEEKEVTSDYRFKAEKLLSAQSSHTVRDTEVTYAHTHSAHKYKCCVPAVKTGTQFVPVT